MARKTKKEKILEEKKEEEEKMDRWTSGERGYNSDQVKAWERDVIEERNELRRKREMKREGKEEAKEKEKERRKGEREKKEGKIIEETVKGRKEIKEVRMTSETKSRIGGLNQAASNSDLMIIGGALALKMEVMEMCKAISY